MANDDQLKIVTAISLLAAIKTLFFNNPDYED